MEYVLTANRLSKYYARNPALEDFEMHIPKGAIYGFVGKNGAGKTTLIRLICGLQEPSAGSFSLLGVQSNNKAIAGARRRIGAVVETPSLILDMTAEENLKYQQIVLNCCSNDDISSLLYLVGLADTGKKKVRDFSLGMKQRLGIAIALVGNPELLILDEPINGLDPQGIIELRKLLVELNQKRKVTILISSHILDELSRLATYYGIIDKGCMIAELSAGELEAACKKYMSVEVSNTTVLAHVLDCLDVDYRIHSQTKADIFQKISVSKLAIALAEKNCELTSVHEHDESLEDFFIRLIGGNRR